MGLDDVVKVAVAAGAAVAGINESEKVKQLAAELEASGMSAEEAMKEALKREAKDLGDSAKETAGKLVDAAEKITGKDLNGDGVIADEAIDVKAAAVKAADSAKTAAGAAVKAAENLVGKDLDGDGVVGDAAPAAEEACPVAEEVVSVAEEFVEAVVDEVAESCGCCGGESTEA